MRDAAIDSPHASGRSADRARSGGAPPLDGLRDERPVSRRAKSGSARVGGVMTSAAIAAQRLGGRRPGRTSPGFLTRLRARMPRVRPFKALTVTVFSAALVGIVTNAMVFQRGRHPAPLFGLGQSVDGVPDASQHAAAPLPAPLAPAPVERTGTITPAPAPLAESAPAAVVPAPTSPHRATPKSHHEGATAAKAKPGIERTAVAAHPRPGHAVPTSAGKVELKPEVKVQAKADPVEKLLAAPVHKAQPAAATRPGSKPEVKKAQPDGHVTVGSAVPAHPRHRLVAADGPADAVKKAAKPD